MSRTASALMGRRLGWSFVPLHGKRPYTPGWQIAPREKLTDLLRWCARGNIGLRTGRASGVVVIDVDPGADVTGLDLPPTVAATTGRGRHLYYRLPAGETVRNSAGRLAPHVDVRGEGGQVVFPGSVHPETGAVYAWVEGLSPSEVPVAELPERIVVRIAD